MGDIWPAMSWHNRALRIVGSGGAIWDRARLFRYLNWGGTLKHRGFRVVATMKTNSYTPHLSGRCYVTRFTTLFRRCRSEWQTRRHHVDAWLILMVEIRRHCRGVRWIRHSNFFKTAWFDFFFSHISLSDNTKSDVFININREINALQINQRNYIHCRMKQNLLRQRGQANS